MKSILNEFSSCNKSYLIRHRDNLIKKAWQWQVHREARQVGARQSFCQNTQFTLNYFAVILFAVAGDKNAGYIPA